MPTQEVARPGSPAALLPTAVHRPHALVLDGSGPDSWADGRALYSDTPRATLEVFASGWGRWRCHGTTRWQWGSPLVQWQRFLDAAPGRLAPREDPAGAGVLTVLGYDLKHWIERLPRRHPWSAAPVLFSALYDWTYGHDYRSGRTWITAPSARDLAARVRDCAAPAVASRSAPATAWAAPRAAMSRDAYRRMVASALETIAAGDIYQVNLAQRFAIAPFAGDPAALFATLCARYPMPFGAYVDGGGWVAVSNSPECLLAVDGDRVATFPIKGTRRGAATDDWVHDPKEQAEHLMIVDLERNDLGRVCETGSVAVREFAVAQTYPLLQHMVSRIEGRLRPATSLADLIGATFPGGSITGAPKIRAMQIIEALEPCARGLYTGSIGWTTLDGRSRFNIAIRTGVIDRTGLIYFAGGGIVADSDPDREYEETLLKSEAFFAALADLQMADTGVPRTA